MTARGVLRLIAVTALMGSAACGSVSAGSAGRPASAGASSSSPPAAAAGTPAPRPAEAAGNLNKMNIRRDESWRNPQKAKYSYMTLSLSETAVQQGDSA
jgi:hypothetical protein